MDPILLAVVAVLVSVLGYQVYTDHSTKKKQQAEAAKRAEHQKLSEANVKLNEEAKKHLKTYDEKNNVIKCSCGYICGTEHIYHLHVEHHGRNMKPKDVSGWPAKHLQTVPCVSNAQKCVFSKNDIPCGLFTSISLTSSFNDKQVKLALSKFQDLTEQVLESVLPAGAKEEDEPSIRLVSLVACNNALWRRFDAAPPAELKSFQTIKTPSQKNVIFPAVTPTTSQQDDLEIFVFAKSNRFDLCYELSKRFIELLNNGHVEQNVAKFDHQQSFGYMPVPMAAKDLSGFLDGTRNPDHLLRALADEVLIFPEDQQAEGTTTSSTKNPHASGTYMYAGKFVHDLLNLKKIAQRSKEERDQIVGRDYDVSAPHKGYDTRPENPKLEKPESNSHIMKAHGSMYRQAMPYITNNEEGLYFICFSRFLSEIDNALLRMAGHEIGKQGSSSADAIDNIFKITKSVTNGYYYVPSLSELRALPSVPTLTKEQAQKIEKANEAATISKQALKKKKVLDILCEYCTNCGYVTIYLEKKKVLEEALKGTSLEHEYEIRVIPNMVHPRLSAFELSIANDGHLLWSKLDQPDGRNNFPHVFPKNSHLVKELRKYLKVEAEGQMPSDEAPLTLGTRVGVW